MILRTPPSATFSPKLRSLFLARWQADCYQFGVASQSGDQRAASKEPAGSNAPFTDLGVGAKSSRPGYGYWEIGR